MRRIVTWHIFLNFLKVFWWAALQSSDLLETRGTAFGGKPLSPQSGLSLGGRLAGQCAIYGSGGVNHGCGGGVKSKVELSSR